MPERAPVHLRMVIPPGPWTGALEDGTVGIPGVGWECISDIDNAPDRFVATKQYDVGENGIRRLAREVLGGSPPVGIPVFFGREHMQRNIIVRDGSSIVHASDLAGKRIGTWLSIVAATTVGVMLMLEQGYSVPLADIEWNTGDPKKLQDNRMGLSLKPGPSSDDKNFQRLLNGDLDAVIVTTGPRYWSMFGPNKRDKTIARYPGLRPLINDPEMMAETYRRTGLCPITDTAVVTAELVNRHPALPAQLVGAFSQANDLAPKYRSEKENDLAQREIQLLGEDPHRYGLGKNQRRNLATLLDLFARLGVLERYIEPEDLFVPSTRSLG